MHWIARLTRNVEFVGSRVNQRPPLFHWARKFSLIALYWLVPGIDSSVSSHVHTLAVSYECFV